ncbi:hypothetical protein TNCV_4138561 [Trichonephila clavipes]|nr:hypothetical protein TNCV_4138561 [Trichonephila clavipes]
MPQPKPAGDYGVKPYQGRRPHYRLRPLTTPTPLGGLQHLEKIRSSPYPGKDYQPLRYWDETVSRTLSKPTGIEIRYGTEMILIRKEEATPLMKCPVFWAPSTTINDTTNGQLSKGYSVQDGG